jgi:hypothetical protein
VWLSNGVNPYHKKQRKDFIEKPFNIEYHLLNVLILLDFVIGTKQSTVGVVYDTNDYL